MDDLPPQKAMYAENKQKWMTPVISSSQVIRCAKILYMAADLLGKEDDKSTYLQDVERISNALQKYSWDEDCGYFSYVIHDENGDAKTYTDVSLLDDNTTIAVKNNPGAALPHTGGPGTRLLYLLGAIMALFAGAALLRGHIRR